MEQYDVVIIGGGPAGMQAAIAAAEKGAERILIIERDRELGGILNQCIHAGFGLTWFKEELTGTEYATRFIRQLSKYIKNNQIEIRLHTMVLQITPDLKLRFISKEKGPEYIQAKAIVASTGCRERTRGAIRVPGTRPAGIYTAGLMQRLVNMEGYLPGQKIIVIGSGDVGLIMSRRLRLEGLEVLGVAEIYNYPGGLMRNIVQCLQDYNIPLWMSTTVTAIHGTERVSGVTLSNVDAFLKPIPGTERKVACDTLLLSAGLIPENEILRSADLTLNFSAVTGGPLVNECLMTDLPGIFACGNNLHVHDLVDNVSLEADTAGKSAAIFAGGHNLYIDRRKVLPGQGVRYCLPAYFPLENKDLLGRGNIPIYLRVDRPYHDVELSLDVDGKEFLTRKLPQARPGEMISVRLDPEKVIGPGDLTISIKGGSFHD